MNSVVICEKPSQAKNVWEAVGNQYGRILAARGHIIRLAQPHEVNPEWKKWSYDILRPANGFYPFKPDATAGKDKVIAEFKSALEGADKVIIATDCDREGQAIGENIIRYLKFKGDVYRAMFNAEDPQSLQEAFSNMQPNKNYLPLYQAAIARVQSDQITNLSMTRAASLALKPPAMKGSIGIGRVKTPAMAIVCRREKEILGFEPRDYFDLWVDISDASDASDSSQQVRLAFAPSDDTRIFDADRAAQIVRQVDGWKGPVSVRREEKKQNPPKLMDLPTLQSRAAKWGWPAKKVLDTAQSLYETHKITTYPRAENKYLPENEIENAPAMLAALTALPFAHVSYDQPTIRKGKAGAFSDKQLAGSSHHAIVPNIKTSQSWSDILGRLSDDERNLFELIATTYLAAIGPDRIYDRTEITADIEGRVFKTVGTVDKQSGWKQAFIEDLDKRDEDTSLPDWPDGREVFVSHAGADRKTTKPPSRYTEGLLVAAMQQAWKFATDPQTAERLKEAKGIGTVATRDTVIEGLKKQGFFIIEKNQIKASQLAMSLYDLLLEETPDIVDPAATAIMELALDDILVGKQEPREVIDALIDKAEVFTEKMRKRGETGQPLDVEFKRTPTSKMIEVATAKAKREGVSLPRGAKSDFEICSRFLGPQPEGNASTKAQVDFAKKIATGARLTIDEETLCDRTKLTEWIDANKDKMPKGGEGDQPSEKQISFAQNIAVKKNIDVPSKALQSRSLLSVWIDKNTDNTRKGTQRGKRVW